MAASFPPPTIRDVITASHKLDPGAPDLLAAYIEAGGSADDADPEYSQWSLLRYAVEHGNEAMIVALLAHGADPNLPSGPDGLAPIHHAAEADIDVTIQATIERDDLHYGFATVQLLVEHRADLNLRTPDGQTARDIAHASHAGIAGDHFDRIFPPVDGT